MRIVNTTPHEVRIMGENNEIIATFPASPAPLRVEETEEKIGEFRDSQIPAFKKTLGKCATLPRVEANYCTRTFRPCLSEGESLNGAHDGNETDCPQLVNADCPYLDTDVIYIVSQIILSAHPEREDFYVPTGIVRDGEGKIIGCKGLAR